MTSTEVETTQSPVQGIAELQDRYFSNAHSKGFWDEYDNATTPGHRLAIISQKLLLIVTEVAEAAEDVRKGLDPSQMYFKMPDGNIVTEQVYVEGNPQGKPVGLPSELADIAIRVLDLSGGLAVDLAKAMETKAIYNERARGKMHGKKF